MKLPRGSIVTLAAGLLITGLLLQPENRSATATTYGDAPWGFAALLELLARLDFPATRNLAAPSSLPPATLWLIEPPHLCRLPGEDDDSPLAANEIDEWVKTGGTVVVFLSSSSVRGQSCGDIGEMAIPPMAPLVCRNVRDGDRCRIEAGAAARERNTFIVDGDNVRHRRLRVDGLRRFRDVGGWRTVASVDGEPFILEHAFGNGRIVLVADSRFLRNQWLHWGDASVLAVDLATMYGTPRLDEWTHGYREHSSVIAFLLRSSALPLLFGFAFTGLVLAWFGFSLPVRTPDADSSAPSLADAVERIAAAYAASADYPHLLQRYREFTSERLRLLLHLPPETSADLLREHLQSRGLLDEERRQALFEAKAPHSPAAIQAMATTLDRLILEVRQ